MRAFLPRQLWRFISINLQMMLLIGRENISISSDDPSEVMGDRCTFFIHRVEHGLEPACVFVCLTHCMHLGDPDVHNPKSAGCSNRAPSCPDTGGGNQIMHLLSDVMNYESIYRTDRLPS
jgi:Fe-S-cluster-containing dehydrogenase component